MINDSSPKVYLHTSIFDLSIFLLPLKPIHHSWSNNIAESILCTQIVHCHSFARKQVDTELQILIDSYQQLLEAAIVKSSDAARFNEATVQVAMTCAAQLRAGLSGRLALESEEITENHSTNAAASALLAPGAGC